MAHPVIRPAKDATADAAPKDRFLANLETRLERLQHKLKSRIHRMSKDRQDENRARTEQQIDQVKAMIKKHKE